jgi:hypothetical protein
MRTRQIPDNADTELLNCINCLSPLLTPWDMDQSILCPQLCNAIFFELNQSENIIENIIENYCPPLDGVSPDSEETQS